MPAAGGYAVLAITAGGRLLGEQLARELNADLYYCKGELRPTLSRVWPRYQGLICIMATGIVVRMIAPLLADKSKDPAVVVCDQQGSYAISLLSGHLGGANSLAARVAGISGGQAVITTASDVLGQTGLDLWCRELGLSIADKAAFTRKMGQLVDQGSLRLYSEFPLPRLPEDLMICQTPEEADLVISTAATTPGKGVLLHPKALALGIGCKRDTPAARIEATVEAACRNHNLAAAAIARLASITLKQDEPGLLAYARDRQLDIRFYTSEQLNTIPSEASSATVYRVTGARAVAEPAAILAAGAEALLVNKIKGAGVTLAIARIPDPLATTA
ncbi:cobalt-precorrin 5A hydrolase [Desulfogranum mediterraneum]|uniref:cobalt-precorrin 5A hydrolase n=1 Tax=Desulfogranum mediterraneum TaxID=160661 RepID=UPI00040E3971|nr:cobalamin biosynthesis protein [Desulfogranum mediterraneum]